MNTIVIGITIIINDIQLLREIPKPIKDIKEPKYEGCRIILYTPFFIIL